MTHPLWPLYDLRLTTADPAVGSLELRLPTKAELPGRGRGWSVDDWVLTLGVWLDGEPVGFQDLRGHEFPRYRTVGTGSWLGQTFQGRGVGTLMRQAVLALAFDHLGAQLAETEAFTDNPASNRVSRGVGYEPNGFGRLAPRGVMRETQRFRLTLEGWRGRPRPAVTVEGLESSLGLFGVRPA